MVLEAVVVPVLRKTKILLLLIFLHRWILFGCLILNLFYMQSSIGCINVIAHCFFQQRGDKKRLIKSKAKERM